MRYGWRLDLDTWKRLADACQGRPWQRTFLESAYEPLVPKAAGVYVICASVKYMDLSSNLLDQLYNALYVGQSRDLRRRFNEHIHGYRSMAKALVTFRRLDYWYTKVETSSLSFIEQRIIDALGPVGNTINVTARINEPIPAGSASGSTKRVR